MSFDVSRAVTNTLSCESIRSAKLLCVVMSISDALGQIAVSFIIKRVQCSIRPAIIVMFSVRYMTSPCVLRSLEDKYNLGY